MEIQDTINEGGAGGISDNNEGITISDGNKETITTISNNNEINGLPTPPITHNTFSTSSTSSPTTSHHYSNSSATSISNIDALSIIPNSSFANNFWSPDYSSGINVIFDKLKQGCAESNEVLDMIQDRVNLENTYATALQSFQDKHKPTKKGFDKDEGASLRLAYLSYINDISMQGISHSQIAGDIDKTVRGPLHSFNQAHKLRVDDNYSLLIAKINKYHKMADQVQKLQNVYYNKCRQREDLDGINGSDKNNLINNNSSITTTVASLGSELSRGLTILKRTVATDKVNLPIPTIPTIKIDTSERAPSPLLRTSTQPTPAVIEVLPGLNYSLEQLQKLIKDLHEEVPLRNHRISMLGVYENVTPGDEIVRWIRKRFDLTVGKAEKFGQSLIKYGFIKPIGQVLGKFVNSSEYYYQWLPKGLGVGVEEDKRVVKTSIESIKNKQEVISPNKRVTSPTTTFSSKSDPESPSLKLQLEITQSEQKYKEQVIQLDLIRCDLEKTIVNILSYMEKCEKERLITIKRALRELSHKISRPQDIDMISKRLFLDQESINSDSDLRYLVENYKTSIFRPNVVTYKNFDDNTICQTFGIDITNVPFIIPIFVDYLEQPKIEESVNLWLLQSPISDIYQVRNQINNGKSFDGNQIFPLFPLQIIISTLKQFLLEMPDSIISFTVYDTIKSFYSNDEKNKNHDLKIENISIALSHLSKPIIAQLNLLIKHLILITKGIDERVVEKLSFHIAPYIFRPRATTSFNMKDKHPGLLIKDLLKYSDEIFTSIQARQSMKTRQRSYSEANRRANVEARNKELVAQSIRVKSRPGSPHRDNSNGINGTSSNSSSKITSNGLIPLALSPSRQVEGMYLSPGNSRHRKSQSNPTRSLQIPMVGPSPRHIEKDLPRVPIERVVERGGVDVKTEERVGERIQEEVQEEKVQELTTSSPSQSPSQDVNDILSSYEQESDSKKEFKTPELQTIPQME